MSDRADFCAFYYAQTGQAAVWIRDEKRFMFSNTELAWQSWQAAQAQAVNQQLLEALQSHRVDVWADSYENKIVVDPDENGDFVYYDAVVAAIAAAQESKRVAF